MISPITCGIFSLLSTRGVSNIMAITVRNMGTGAVIRGAVEGMANDSNIAVQNYSKVPEFRKC